MGYTCDFLDNIAYGADAINGIRSTFASKGVIPDEIDSCAVSLEGQIVKIKKGQALFEDGCRIQIGTEVGEEYVTLARIPSIKNYVFLQRNKQQNNPLIAISDSPCGADDIFLAEIAIGGTVTDRRSFSALKVPSMQGNHTQELILSVNQYIQGQAHQWILLEAIDLDFFGYQYITLFEINTHYNHYIYYGVQNLLDNSAIGFLQPREGSETDYYTYAGDCMKIASNEYLKFEMVGGKLNCYYKAQSYAYTMTKAFTIRLT